MTRCHALSDRMPEVAASGSRWTPEEAAHLAACQECAAEWRLVGTAAALGRKAVSSLDSGRVADAVLARLRAAPAAAAPRQWRVRRVLVPAAAAAALLTAVWFGGPTSVPLPLPETLFAVLPELDDLDETELESLAEEFTGAGADALRPLDAAESFGDLSDAELESLLRLMEG